MKYFSYFILYCNLTIALNAFAQNCPIGEDEISEMTGVLLCPPPAKSPIIQHDLLKGSSELAGIDSKKYLDVCNQASKKKNFRAVIAGAGLTAEAFVQLYNKFTLLPHALASVPDSAVDAIYKGMREKSVGPGDSAKIEKQFQQLMSGNIDRLGLNNYTKSGIEKGVKDMIREGLAYKFLANNGYSLGALSDSKAVAGMSRAARAASKEQQAFFRTINFGYSLTHDIHNGDLKQRYKKGDANTKAQFVEINKKIESYAKDIVNDPKILEASTQFAKNISSRLSETISGRMLELMGERMGNLTRTLGVRASAAGARLGATALLALGPVGDVLFLLEATSTNTACAGRVSEIAEFDINANCAYKTSLNMKTFWGLANPSSTVAELSDNLKICKAYLEMYKTFVLQIPGSEESSKVTCNDGNKITWNTNGVSGFKFNENSTNLSSKLTSIITAGGKPAKEVQIYNATISEERLAKELLEYCNNRPSLLKFNPSVRSDTTTRNHLIPR